MNLEEKTILYIDDEQQNLDGFELVFYQDYTIFTTTKVSEAFEIIKNNQIKVIISDQKMPEMTGLDFIAKVKDSNPHIVCLILTAYADMKAVMEAVNQGGIFRYLMKPWDEADLGLSIESALERYNYISENKRLVADIKNKNIELERYNQQLKDTIEEYKAAKEKAEESDRLKQSFLQNISHEIRTPMNGILGFADLLRNPELSEKSKLYFIDTINTSGHQLMEIIENVLDIAKIEAGQVELKEVAVNINKLLQEIYAFHSLQLMNRNIHLVFDNPYENKSFTVKTDKVRIRQMLDNLLTNARKFTLEGEIRLKVIQELNEVIFIVEDTGIGIPEDSLNSIFKPFRQVESSVENSRKGTGLGLAITNSIIEMMGGTVWVQSKMGEGTLFRVSLPLEFMDEIKEEIITEEEDFYFPEKINILVVEDDEVSFNYLNTILQQMNLITHHVTKGREVYGYFEKYNSIDMVLMDIKLPDMSGLEVTKKLRSDGMQMPIIAQTSFALTNIREDALKAGCNDFITKPFFKKDLYYAIKNQMSRT